MNGNNLKWFTIENTPSLEKMNKELKFYVGLSPIKLGESRVSVHSAPHEPFADLIMETWWRWRYFVSNLSCIFTFSLNETISNSERYGINITWKHVDYREWEHN